MKINPIWPIKSSGLAALMLSTFVMNAPVHAQQGGPIRALAQEHIVYDESPNRYTIPLYTPSILRASRGRLVAASERSGEWRTKLKNPNARICTSDDDGRTWTPRATARMSHARLFKAGNSLYYLGHHRDLQIMRSDDNGTTWTVPFKLTTGQQWHGSATNVWHAKGNVYLVMERLTSKEIKGWAVGTLAPVLMRAKETDDLTKRESWTFASEITFDKVVKGYRQNNPELGPFGIPFYKQAFPVQNVIVEDPRRAMAPMGWLEANVVQVMDPNHYWYDPDGDTFHIFMRAHTGRTGYAAMAKVKENADGTMTTSLEQVPAGTDILYLPWPGGQMRFHLLYDHKTELYWLLSTQTTDSMTRADKLERQRYDLPYNERQRLVLHFSKNLVDWCFAGLVAVGPENVGSRHYASMDIDGNDLIILSRSGDKDAKSSHDGNLITFHRVKNFRDLVY